jgi:signal peptidase II
MRPLEGQRNKLKFCAICLGVIVLADQLSKYFILRSLCPFQSLPVFKNIFHITLVLNPGIAFGLFKNQVLFYLVLPVAAIIWLSYTLFFSKSREGFNKVYYFALSLILGGAIGNLIDRLRFGYVIDFLDFRIWPVFNFADSAISIGIAIIILKCFPLSAK